MHFHFNVFLLRQLQLQRHDKWEYTSLLSFNFSNIVNYKTSDMTLDELSKKLNEMYVNAPKGGKVTMSILFGIKYCDHIINVGLKSVIQQSGLPINYYSEVSKGVKLASHVSLIK